MCSTRNQSADFDRPDLTSSPTYSGQIGARKPWQLEDFLQALRTPGFVVYMGGYVAVLVWFKWVDFYHTHLRQRAHRPSRTIYFAYFSSSICSGSYTPLVVGAAPV